MSKAAETKAIEHTGTVLLVDGDRIDVEITVDSACASCKAKQACGVGEGKERVISLLTESAGHYAEGERVIVYIEQKMGMKAAAYAYIYPLFVMLAVLFAMFEYGVSEIVAGLCALGAILLYYIVLAFFKHKIEKEFVFKLAKI